MFLFIWLRLFFSGKFLLFKCFFVSLFAIFTTVAISEAVQGQIFASLITAIPSIGMLLVLMRGQNRMHLQMNSRLDELVKAKGDSERAAGVAQERGEARARSDAAGAAVAEERKHPVEVAVKPPETEPVPKI